MEIKIYGPGCKNCKKLLANVEQAVEELDLEANIIKVEDLSEIITDGVMRTPGLALEGEIIAKGKVLEVTEIKQLIIDQQER